MRAVLHSPGAGSPQLDGERRSVSEFTVDVNPATVGLDDLSRDPQAQSTSWHTPVLVEAHEAIENASVLLGRNPDPAVSYGKMSLFGVASNRDFDWLALSVFASV